MAREVETEPEVTGWYLQLSGDERDVVAAHIDLLANFGHTLRMPHARTPARSGRDFTGGAPACCVPRDAIALMDRGDYARELGRLSGRCRR